VNWTQDRLQQLANCCWGEVTRFLKPDSCVLATRVFVDALNALGEQGADGMVALAIVMSPNAAEHSLEHGCNQRITECPERGDRAVAILGWEPNAPARGFTEVWSGHLVAVVRRQWLVDLSLPQVHRPELGLVIDSPLVVELPRDFFKGGKSADLHEDSGMRLLYTAMPNARADWRQSPDWAWGSQVRRELGLGTLARFRGQDYHYPDSLLRIFAFTGKI
jgi:hypothetical protein